MIAFEIREPLRGSYFLFDAQTETRAAEATLHVRGHVVRGALGDRKIDISGNVRFEKLAEDAALEGTIAFRLPDEGRLPYEFSFTGDDGRRYAVRGQKDFLPIGPASSLSTLPFSLYDDGETEIGRGTLRFDWRADYGKFLRSLRLRPTLKALLGNNS